MMGSHTQTTLQIQTSKYAVFGWFQDSFIGMEQEIAHRLSAGYLKGAEQAGAGATIMLNVMSIFGNACK